MIISLCQMYEDYIFLILQLQPKTAMGHLHTLTSFCVCPIREGIVLHVLNPFTLFLFLYSINDDDYFSC